MLKLMAVGDISLQTPSGGHPFENVRGIFESKDILFGNLETVLSNQRKKAEKAVVLDSSPKKVKYLKDVGFDILNIANNHIMDLGSEGFHDTLGTLRKEGLSFIGANDKSEQSYAILEKHGIRLGFLGYTQGRFSLPEKRVWINELNLSDIAGDIESLKRQCDSVIISLHWGTENVFYPSPKQIDLAHRLIDTGATIILGHHPHVIQGIDRYKHGLIAYSLGNFQFNPEISYTKTNNSMILCSELSKEGLENYYIIPVVIDQYFSPGVSGEAKEEISSFVRSLSEPISSGTLTWGWWFEQIAEEYLSGNMKSFIIRVRRYGIKHLLQAVIWLLSPFCLRCYAAVIGRRFRRSFRKA